MFKHIEKFHLHAFYYLFHFQETHFVLFWEHGSEYILLKTLKICSCFFNLIWAKDKLYFI